MSFTIDQLVIFAARAGNLALLKERVMAGGSVNYIDAKHGSALVEAINRRDMPILGWLLANGAEVNVQYRDGVGPLEIALRHPDPEMVYRLVCAGAKLRRTTRPHYRNRLDECLRMISEKTNSGEQRAASDAARKRRA